MAYDTDEKNIKKVKQSPNLKKKNFCVYIMLRKKVKNNESKSFK